MLDRDLSNAEDQNQGPIIFSQFVAHGERNTNLGSVMMTRIEDSDGVFVHGSDIQLLDGEAVSLILAWRPGIVLVGGPPLYLPWLSLEQRERAWKSALRLAGAVDTLILDHHLLRSEEGLSWLECLVSKTSHRVMCAAGFMKHPIRLLEPWRAKLYDEMAVPEGWHEVYARGEADTSAYSEHQFSIPTVGPARRHKWPSPRPLENG